MTDNELNMKVCEALGWTKEPIVLGADETSWNVPDSQPWNGVWNRTLSTCISTGDVYCPDFLNDPAEAWRLMVWAKARIDYGYGLKGQRRWEVRVWSHGRFDLISPARALVLAFLASRGVEVPNE